MSKEAVLRDVLDRWRAGLAAHEPQQVAALFTEDAIFQGLRPYSVGRDGVAAYYDAQPPGLAAAYRVLEIKEPADDLVLGYLAVDFTFTDRPALHVNLGVLLRRTAEGWRIAHYQVSHLD
ncbi:SgcJ/EcaC family oxidoreductase [Actinomadura sp. ATCC 31491]|uniref:SgcJ/EcaC family oxidoreductase n=1 Tax=Actinomadura luzonensis TaxID=2805427 RepID=A0ABT0GBG4_9ACTN|nr:SgcJ/EcaC family oxidoreductase [Actinomadura luzonensis]MCK2221819.1 SgcJ/EcaC family oxidoreductase [Actinomadura luzonensis]